MTATSTIGVLGYDPFGDHLAGPALRSWQLALQVATVAPVEFWAEGTPPDAPAGTDLRIRSFHPELFLAAAPTYGGVVLPSQAALRDRRLFDLPCPVVVDCYDPFPLETAVHLTGAAKTEQRFRTRLQAWASLHAVAHGDYHLVANEFQRAYLGGLLVASGAMTPGLTQADGSINARTLLVPTGFDPGFVTHAAAGAAEGTAHVVGWGVPAGARFVLWSGGLWPWLDPLLVLDAFTRVAETHPDLHLVFPGATAPNPNSPQAATVQALQSAIRGNPHSRRIHLVEWIPFFDWPTVAAQAAVHVSAHRDGWEAWLSSRTRFVDAIALGIPVVATSGDPLGAELAAAGVGFMASSGSASDFAEALRTALTSNGGDWTRLRARYAWHAAAAPLVEAVRRGLRVSPDRAARKEVNEWIAGYPIPNPPGVLEKVWGKVRGK